MPNSSADLARIRVRYATFREQGMEDRAEIAARLAGLAATERVLLDTCHRVELVSVEDAPADPATRATGRDAVRRVFEVVAGFDSAVIAEEQLLGQVRRAYEGALTEGSSGPILNELFRRALRFGRRVRTHARPGSDRSLADLGSAWLLDHVPPRAMVLVAGTGEMGRRVALRMAESGHRVTVISASIERGRSVVERLPGSEHRVHHGSLDREMVAAADAIALAVRSRRPLMTAENTPESHNPWSLDLSMPAAVDRGVAGRLGTRLLGLDRLSEVQPPAPVLDPAVERRLRRELDEAVEDFTGWLEVRGRGDALSTLHAEAVAVRERHLDRLRRRAALNEDQLAAVEAASAAMLGELLHRPYVALRSGAADAETVRRLFGLEP